jgi:type II secretory pathway pseudopilin PulG
MKPDKTLKAITGKRRSAFTLIEIMVATVIMIVLTGLVIQITSEVLKVWNRSSGKLSANAEARIALDLITQDLETAVFRNNGQQWLRVEAPVDPGGNYTSQTVALKLFSPALDRPKFEADGVTAIPGDICGIAYRLAFKESYAGGDNVYALYRFIEDPKDTFNNLMGPSTTDPDVQKSLIGGVWGETNVTSENNYLASNIIEFKVLIYEDDGAANPTPVNADADGNVSNPYYYGGSSGSSSPLLYADILLTIISDDGLELIQRVADVGPSGTGYTGSKSEATASIVRQHGEVFTRRVNFLARPL